MTSYIVMLPRIEARESLRRSAEVALGSGVMKKDTAREMSREWQRAAEPKRRARKAGPKDLARLPMKVTRVPTKEKS